MAFSPDTAAKQIDPTSCGCCTTAYGLKILHEENLLQNPLTTPNGVALANQARPFYFNYASQEMEQDLHGIRVRRGGYTMPSAIVETILTNGNGIQVVLETSPGIETLFNKIGYSAEITTVKQIIGNHANASHVYFDSYIRRPRSTHLFSIGLMQRKLGAELHWLFQAGSNGSWCDPGDPKNNNHWLKWHTAYQSANSGDKPTSVGVNIYVYK